ncbi:MAG TPA: hypothetical protein VFK54_04710 [Candidatus Limnocylindrales bacterium]|nr:hypothetical protein [Candidatus Limnocylindrales bacterium]
MTTHKVFKQRVRARMAKTGESYTTARQQLIRRAGPGAPASTDPAPATAAPAAPPMSDAATIRATGRSQADWFARIDAAGVGAQGHTAIARWLVTEHGVGGWWSQSITVGYERARGLRAKGQMADGFTISATLTIAADPDRVLDAFVRADERERWLPGLGLSQRRTSAANTARFDWLEPASRIVVWATPRPDGRTTVTVSHERLPDAATGERMQVFWRSKLVELAGLLGAGGGGGSGA